MNHILYALIATYLPTRLYVATALLIPQNSHIHHLPLSHLHALLCHASFYYTCGTGTFYYSSAGWHCSSLPHWEAGGLCHIHIKMRLQTRWVVGRFGPLPSYNSGRNVTPYHSQQGMPEEGLSPACALLTFSKERKNTYGGMNLTGSTYGSALHAIRAASRAQVLALLVSRFLLDSGTPHFSTSTALHATAWVCWHTTPPIPQPTLFISPAGRTGWRRTLPFFRLAMPDYHRPAY